MQKLNNFVKTLFGGEKKRQKLFVLFASLFLILVTVILTLTVGKRMLALVSDVVAFKAWLDQYHAYSRVVFVAIRAAQTVVKLIPAEPLEIGSGFAFGIWGGLFYCMLGTLLGSLVIILLTKKFGLKAVTLFVSEEKINSMRFLQNQSRVFSILFFIYLIPGSPKDFITYLIGVTKINIWKFLLVTSIARIPSIVTSTWCGYKIVTQDYWAAAWIFAITALAGVLGALLYRVIEKRLKRTEQAAQDEDAQTP